MREPEQGQCCHCEREWPTMVMLPAGENIWICFRCSLAALASKLARCEDLERRVEQLEGSLLTDRVAGALSGLLRPDRGGVH